MTHSMSVSKTSSRPPMLSELNMQNGSSFSAEPRCDDHPPIFGTNGETTTKRKEVKSIFAKIVHNIIIDISILIPSFYDVKYLENF